MSDESIESEQEDEAGDRVDESTDPVFEAAEYANGAVSYPPHRVGPNGVDRVGTVDLSKYRAEVVTWTEATATPPGVREPNTLAIVAFDLGDDYDGPPVRALGQIVADEDVEIGETVEATYADDLREPGAGIREPDSQDWDGFRFRPVE